MDKITIVKIPENKWQDYKDIRLEALKMDSIAFGSSFEEERNFNEDTWKQRSKPALLAYYDDKPVGLLVYIINTRIKTKHVANIYSVYVNKAFRGHGIGKKLVIEALESIKKNDEVIKVNLAVNPEQISAVKLYESFGFKQIGRLSKEIFENNIFYDQLLMELFL